MVTIGWLENYLRGLARDCIEGPKDGIKAALTGRTPGQVRAERRERERQNLEGFFAQAALEAYRQYEAMMEGQRGKNKVQFKDEHVRVEVQSGYSRDYACWTTDIKVIDLDPNVRVHMHIIFDEHGTEIFREWRPDHAKKR